MGKLKLEDDFDREAAKFRLKNDEIVRKARDKKQNVWKSGEMFKTADSVRFLRRTRNGLYNIIFLRNSIVISASDSDQYTTFETDTLYVLGSSSYAYGYSHAPKPVEPPLPAYHLFPFLLGTEIVWFMLTGCDEPMANLRASFNRMFKKV